MLRRLEDDYILDDECLLIHDFDNLHIIARFLRTIEVGDQDPGTYTRIELRMEWNGQTMGQLRYTII